MGVAQKGKCPPKHFLQPALPGGEQTGSHRPGAYERPQVHHRHSGASVKGMNKAQAWARTGGGPKMAGAKLQLKFTLIRTIRPLPCHRKPLLGSGKNQNIRLSLLRHVQPGALPELVNTRWNGGIERKLEPHGLMRQCQLKFPCHL